jgi:glycosyltransferase involved in cell wall biosynthesis
VKLVVVTQRVDPGDPALGATVDKLRALASRVDSLVVLAEGAVPDVLPANCRVRPFAAGSRAGRGARFARALAGELGGRPRPAAVLAHMCPIYAVLAAPLARPLGVRVMLWFAHWHRTRTLELAVRAANVVVSVDRRSVPVDSEKVVGIGHGIDVGALGCTERPAPDGRIRLLALGRTSPAKGLDVVVRAVAAVPSARLEIRGPSLTDEERRHRSELERLAATLGAGERVVVAGPVPRAKVPDLFAGCDALVNNMRAGAPDKVVYEAAAGCVPVLASNPLFDGLLPDELRFPREDADVLAERIRGLATVDAAAVGRALRARVVAEHSVEHWADRVVGLAARP